MLSGCMSTIIHIGFPKAASTWLQQSLFPAVKNYEIVIESVVSEKLLKPGSFVFDPVACGKFFSAYSNKPLLISDERFLGSFNLGWNNGAYTKELAGRLKNVFPEATILLVIRNQADIIASAYAQYIKDGGTLSIQRFLYPPENFTFQNILKFSFEQLEYDRIIRYFETLFPKKVKVFLYEDLQDDPGNFIQKLSADLDFEIDKESITFRSRNPRYSRSILRLARITNIFTRNGSINKYYLIHIPGFHSFSKRFWKLCNRAIEMGKPEKSIKILGKENFKKISAYYTVSNRNLTDFVNEESLRKYNYPL